MLSEKMGQALNKQVTAEFYSSYFYLGMHAYFESKNLEGFAHWMRFQAQEEMMHGMKLYDYINERGGKIMLQPIDQPPGDWDSVLHVFEKVLEHEQKVTAMINNLVDLALDERDHATNGFLQWFVSEQVEEESNVGGIVNKLTMVQDDLSGLFVMDQELGKRLPPTVE
ncbi:MAG: ferritin [Desulfobulbaceae bacterium]|jgi:ferritin|nr:ferritin [Desulfobulbaceae bacterium]